MDVDPVLLSSECLEPSMIFLLFSSNFEPLSLNLQKQTIKNENRQQSRLIKQIYVIILSRKSYRICCDNNSCFFQEFISRRLHVLKFDIIHQGKSATFPTKFLKNFAVICFWWHEKVDERSSEFLRIHVEKIDDRRILIFTC